MATLLGERYELGDLLGAGAMGSVYHGVDRTTQQPVAIKHMKPALANHTGALERFKREGEALAQLNHPNIVTMLDALSEGDDNYIIMEYVGGGDLYDLIEKEGRLPADRALSIALDLADALTRAHRLDIIHRDLKPANVLIAADGTPRLTDFGVAYIAGQESLTQAGSLVGTYAYLSPEACMGLPLDERSDIWAFGIILYEMLAGVRPFKGNTPATIITSILNVPAPDIRESVPGISDDLSDLLDRMLTKNRDARIPSIRLVGAELEAIIKGQGGRTMGGVLATPVGVRPSSVFGEATPTPSDLVVPHNVPSQITPFIGRKGDIRELNEQLGVQCRLITLIGPGGAGKTRLAVEVANRHVLSSALYTHGIYVIQLAAITSPDLIATEVGETIGMEFGSGDLHQQVIDYLRNKRMLLIFDNFEHLLDGADLLDAILNNAPQVHMLVTSRARLNLAAECLYEVGGLATPTNDTGEDFDTYEAVQMFVTFARRAQPGYALADEDRAPVARITQLVDGMPLGLELAAAWARLLSPAEIAEELAENLDFLETDARDTPERQRSIQAVFDYSWDLMNEAERDAFLRLTVFRGGFTRKAAKKVAGASLLTLRNLVDKSLLRRDPQGRYFIHQMLRQYGQRKLAAQPQLAEEVGDAHRLYYVDYVDAFSDKLDGPELDLFLKAFDMEYDNIRAAAIWAAEHGDGIAVSRLVAPMNNYFEGRGRILDAVSLFKAMASAIADDSEHRVAYAMSLNGWARFLPRLGRYEQTLTVLGQAEAILREEGAYNELGQVLVWKSYAQMFVATLEEAEASNLEAIALLDEHGETIPRQTAYANYGYLLYLKGEYDKARDFMHKSEYTKEGSHNPVGMAYGFNNLGEVERAVGNLEEALSLFRRSHEIFAELNNKRGQAFSSANVGDVLATQGRIDEAMAMVNTALLMYREIGDRRGESDALYQLGSLNAATPEGQQAGYEFYQQALAVRQEIGDLRGMAEAENAIGLLALEMGNSKEAQAHFTRALENARQIGAQSVETFALNNLGTLCFAIGDLAEARDYLQQSLTISQASGEVARMAFALRVLGIIALEENKPDEAHTHLSESRALYYDMEAITGLAFTEGWLGTVERIRGDQAAARAHFAEALRSAQQADHLVAAVPAIAQIAASKQADGDNAQAVELFTLALRYGLPLTGQRERITARLEALRAELGDAAFAEAEAAGQAATLEQTITRLLAEFNGA